MMFKGFCRCGNLGEWPDGFVGDVEMFLCQDCHEAEVDAAWWETMGEIWAGTHAPGSVPPWHDTTNEVMDRMEEEEPMYALEPERPTDAEYAYFHESEDGEE